MLRVNSTVTATLRQIVMEGLSTSACHPARRLTTRAIAIVPAAIVTIWYGGPERRSLILSGRARPGAAVLDRAAGDVHADRAKMGELMAPRWVTVLAALTGAVLIALNMKLMYDQIAG